MTRACDTEDYQDCNCRVRCGALRGAPYLRYKRRIYPSRGRGTKGTLPLHGCEKYYFAVFVRPVEAATVTRIASNTGDGQLRLRPDPVRA